MSERKTAKLEWSRWCPFPKVGMRVEYTVVGGDGTHVGVSHGSYFVGGGCRVDGDDVEAWRPETVVVDLPNA